MKYYLYKSLTKAVSLVLCSSCQGAYYTQPVYAAQPHVIHHTTVVQPNSIPSTALYPAPVPVPAPRNNGMAAMGMVAGTTMAMSAGKITIKDYFFISVLRCCKLN